MELDIILISYNQEAFIARAVDSILAQRLAEDVKLKLIVADDVSTDGTPDIIKEHLAGSCIPAEFLPKEKNIGYIRNYKQAFAACMGDYVAILEGDDYWLEGHLQQHIDFLTAHEEYSMSMNRHFRLMPGGEFKEGGWGSMGDFRTVGIDEQLGSGNQLGNLSACMFRGSLVRSIPDPFYDLNMADWELGAYMAQFGPIAILRQQTSVYRISDKGQWAGLTDGEKKAALVADLRAMDSFFGGKYHAFCRKYEFKIKHPKLQRIKHSCGVALRRLFGK